MHSNFSQLEKQFCLVGGSQMGSFLDPLPIASMTVLAFNAIVPNIQEQLVKANHIRQFGMQKILKRRQI